MWTQSGEVLEYYQSLKLIRAKSQVMNGLVTKSCEPTGNARELDINERIASFPTIYDTLWFHKVSEFFHPIILFSALLDKGVLKTQKTAYGPKKWLFSDFFSLAHLHIEAQLFCVYQNFISSAVPRNHGRTRISITSTNERGRRTTWTIIIPRQDSQNPRANKSWTIDKLHYV